MPIVIDSKTSENRRLVLQTLINKYYSNINDFCTKNGEDYSLVHKYLSGKVKIGNVPIKRFEKIFDLSVGAFDLNITEHKSYSIPIYLSSATYNSIENLKNRDPYTNRTIDGDVLNQLNIDPNDALGIAIENDSMAPKILTGWIVLINIADNTIIDGHTYACLINQHIVIRQIYYMYEESLLNLTPLNQKFETIKVEKNDVQIIGKASYIMGGCI